MQPATFRRFFVSTQIYFRKTQLAVALAAALTAGGASALTVINDDVQVVGDGNDATPNVTIGTVTETKTSDPFTGTPMVTLPSDPVALTTVIYTVTGDDASDTTKTEATGGATVDNNGNVKLSGGYTTTVTTTYDQALKVVINSDPTSPDKTDINLDGTIDAADCTPANFGCVISETTVVGTWDGSDTGNFVEGMPAPGEPVTTLQPGGNLDMTGKATIGSGLDVSTGGGSTLKVETDQIVMKGGSSSTTVTVNNAGVNVVDSVNGQTFNLDNAGNVLVKNGLTVGGATLTNGLTSTGAVQVNNTLGVTGLTSTAGIQNIGNILTTTLNTTGDAAVGGNASVAGNLGVTGATTTNGITNAGGLTNTGGLTTDTLTVTGASTTNGITNTGNIATDTLTTTGNASVGGNAAIAGNATVGGTLGVTGATTLGNTLTVAGATTLNGATQVNNTLGVTGATTLGNKLTVAGATTLNGATTINNTLNVTGATTTAGVTNNGTLTNNGDAVFTGSGGAAAVEIHANTSTRALDSFGGVRMQANKDTSVVPGGVYRSEFQVDATNGVLAQTKNAAGTTIGTVQVAPTGAVSAVGNGAAMQVDGTYAELHNSDYNGLYVESNRSQLYGGTASSYSSLTLNGAGAAFAGPSGQPVRVTGVADGKNQHDAVNKSQLDEVDSRANAGVAAAVALAGIPAPAAGKNYTVGVGWGNYEGENAFALGGRAQVTPEFQLTAGWGYSNEGNAFNVGAGYSW
jgi:trimeric autotransporter adhesin